MFLAAFKPCHSQADERAQVLPPVGEGSLNHANLSPREGTLTPTLAPELVTPLNNVHIFLYLIGNMPSLPRKPQRSNQSLYNLLNVCGIISHHIQSTFLVCEGPFSVYRVTTTYAYKEHL